MCGSSFEEARNTLADRRADMPVGSVAAGMVASDRIPRTALSVLAVLRTLSVTRRGMARSIAPWPLWRVRPTTRARP